MNYSKYGDDDDQQTYIYLNRWNYHTLYKTSSDMN